MPQSPKIGGRSIRSRMWSLNRFAHRCVSSFHWRLTVRHHLWLVSATTRWAASTTSTRRWFLLRQPWYGAHPLCMCCHVRPLLLLSKMICIGFIGVLLIEIPQLFEDITWIELRIAVWAFLQSRMPNHLSLDVLLRSDSCLSLRANMPCSPYRSRVADVEGCRDNFCSVQYIKDLTTRDTENSDNALGLRHEEDLAIQNQVNLKHSIIGIDLRCA